MTHLTILLLAMFLFSCGPSIPPGQIMIKNDSQDREYNVIKISAGGASHQLAPGEFAILPKGVTSISFSREYKEYTRQYKVSCPGKQNKGIMIKLIDVHLNRMPGGCVTIGASK